VRGPREHELAPEPITPTDYEQAAAALAAAAAAQRPVRVVGGATKLAWGAPDAAEPTPLRTAAMDRILEHNAGDMTATVQAGAPLARVQSELAAHGQMLAIDPPDCDGRATLGGVFATADSGPLRHRYGQPRDLVLGISVALSDGTIAKAGSRVIKNVAGYDLAKLFTGSYGTLGMILALTVRLHPLPAARVTARGYATDPEVLAAAAISLARASLELESLDVAWQHGRGELLARVAGAEAQHRATAIVRRMRQLALEDAELEADDDRLWERQRIAQRSASRAIVQLGCRPTELGSLLALAEQHHGTLVGRAAVGPLFIELEPEQIDGFRRGLPPGRPAVVLDLPQRHHGAIDRWNAPEGAAVELMRAVKRRFDPAAICSPGVFVGGI
jgi:glycolate oxidase FAD binding subunit